MGNIFKRFGIDTDDPKMQKAALYSKYSAARINLLLLVAFSVLNILILVTTSGSGGYFMFCAAIPYQIVNYGMISCGMYSQEFYEKNSIEPLFENSFIAVFITIGLLIVVLYLLCWLFSKKRSGDKWLSFALAMVSADTMVALLVGGSLGRLVVDLLFHALLIILLFNGIGAYKKLRALSKEEAIDSEEEEYNASETQYDVENQYGNDNEENLR